jgi:DHA1 family multidrug resistance protein-like MFS transporter
MSAAPQLLPDNEPSDVISSASAPPAPLPWTFLVFMAVVALLAEMAYGIVNNSTMPPYLRYAMGVPKLVGTIGGAFLLSEAVLTGPAGILADRFGRRALMAVGPTLSVAACVIYSLIRMPPHGTGRLAILGALVVLRILDGAGAACLWPAMFASIGDRVSVERQSQAMGVLNVSYMIGIATGPLIGGLLNDRYARLLNLHMHDPLRYVPSFVAAAGAFLIAGIICMTVAPNRAEQKQRTAAAASSGEGGPVTLASLVEALRKIPMLVLLVVVLFFAIGLIAPNVEIYALERLNVNQAQFGELLLWPGLIVGLMALPLGKLGDLWGRVRAIQVGCAIAGASLWLILFFESRLALEVIGSLLGIGFVLAFPAYLAFISEIGGDKARGSMIGAVKTFQGVGMLAGFVLGSPLYQASPLLPFTCAGIMLSIGFIISLTVREPKIEPGAAG